MTKVLFAGPITGKSGGIAVWSQKFIKLFPDNEFQLISIDLTTKMEAGVTMSLPYRAKKGVQLLIELLSDAKKAIKENPDIKLMHITTSGSYGSIRDYLMANLCHRHGIKCIMHCRYGCIPEDFESHSFWGYLLRKTMHKYDHIWVLDSRSELALKKDPKMTAKVFLTPNSIDVPSSCNLKPKTFTSVAFIAHLYPTKGIYELVQAVVELGDKVHLNIVGPGAEQVIDKITTLAGDKLNKSIFLLGPKPNSEAMKILMDSDILALPTYYPSEGFPISIIEAMSYGKLVLSCPRAAVQDMLTAVDGSECGLLVEPKSSIAIMKALEWCLNNTIDADKLCAKAYQKVKLCYDTSVVYELYRSLYRELI